MNATKGGSMRRKGLLLVAAAVAVGGIGGFYARSGDAGRPIVPPAAPKMAVFNDSARADAAEPELASSLSAVADRIDTSKGLVLGAGLGRFDSRLVAFPSASGSTICYALLGASAHDAAMSYCYQPLAPDEPSALLGQHFDAVALYSNIDNNPGTQLYGIAFDDVKSIRANIAGTWRAVPLKHNGFYLDLPNVAQEDVGIVEATLKDGTVQRHNIQTGG
jgi:hypothetical protein